MDEFEDLKDYEKLYKINRKGEIWSCYYKRLMKPTLNNGTGYYTTEIVKDKNRKMAHIHRLLAIQYLPNPNNLPMVDHIDRNKLNNCLENLRWASARTNNLNMGITPKSGHQNIYIDNYNQCIVNIRVNGNRYTKRFYELKDAIAWRDKTLQDFQII
jgi:hypothetical protein